MLAQAIQKRLFPLIQQALDLGQTALSDLNTGDPRLSQLSQGIHLIDEQTLVERAQVMQKHIWPHGRGTNLFAVKGQPNHYVLRTLQNCGFGFDCSSPTEILDALAVGATSGSMMYTANATPSSHLKFAMDHGATINLDDACYLEMLSVVPETLSFRVNIATLREKGEQNRIIGAGEEQKFGVPVEHLVAAYRQALGMGVKRFGLHTMYASNNRSWQVHHKTVEILLELASQLYRELGIRLAFINAGGGIGVDYKSPNDPSVEYGEDDKPFDLERYGQEVNQLFETFEAAHQWRPDFFLECARYVAAPAGAWVVPIIAVAEKYRRFACMGASDSADLLRAGMYPAHHHVIVLGSDVGRRPIIKQSIVGPLCENIHAVSERLLPEIRVGDWVVFCDAGCHGIEMGMNYNGWTKSAQVMRRIDGSLVLISRAQTIADLRATQIPLD